MENRDKKTFKDYLSYLYQGYHFVAKVFLYSILLILILVGIGFAAYSVDLIHNIRMGETKYPLLSAYVIVTPSMVPTINVEDAIIVMRKEPEELKKKDIITFTSTDPRYSGLTITHRIVGIEKMSNGEIYYRTKGDNNNVEDASLVPYSSVYGKVILKIPMIGYIQYILMQVYGWVILVVVPCLGIVIYDMYKLFSSINKKYKKKDDTTPEVHNNINNGGNTKHFSFIQMNEKKERYSDKNKDKAREVKERKKDKNNVDKSVTYNNNNNSKKVKKDKSKKIDNEII